MDVPSVVFDHYERPPKESHYTSNNGRSRKISKKWDQRTFSYCPRQYFVWLGLRESRVYLSDLIKELNTIDGIDWIRIHYAHLHTSLKESSMLWLSAIKYVTILICQSNMQLTKF